MTMHTMRGSIGLMKYLYQWSVNVITSCDMGIFMATSSGGIDVARQIAQKKLDEATTAQSLYWGQLLTMQYESGIAWAWMYDVWMHFIEFHMMSTAEIIQHMDNEPQKAPDCKWDPLPSIIHYTPPEQ